MAQLVVMKIDHIAQRYHIHIGRVYDWTKWYPKPDSMRHTHWRNGSQIHSANALAANPPNAFTAPDVKCDQNPSFADAIPSSVEPKDSNSAPSKGA